MALFCCQKQFVQKSAVSYAQWCAIPYPCCQSMQANLGYGGRGKKVELMLQRFVACPLRIRYNFILRVIFILVLLVYMQKTNILFLFLKKMLQPLL